MAQPYLPRLLIPLWLLLTGLGFSLVSSYGSEPGEATTAPDSIDFALINIDKTPSNKLLMFLHPKCSCSLASVNEMARLMSRIKNKPELYIYFADPFENDELINSQLWQLSNNIPNSHVIRDKDSSIAKQLQAETSGSVILYDATGRLLFHGGITASRGHEGSSFGLQALTNLLNEKNNKILSSNVYGCGLRG
jgi:hypothetical protein